MKVAVIIKRLGDNKNERRYKDSVRKIYQTSQIRNLSSISNYCKHRSAINVGYRIYDGYRSPNNQKAVEKEPEMGNSMNNI